MIELKNVSVWFKKGLFGKIQALNNLNLKIEKGSIFGLLGPNGAGKSTAMYCMLGLIRPDYGTVSIMGESVYFGAEIFKKIGYLPEEAHYHLYLTVEEAIRYYADLYNIEISLKKQYELMERFGLLEFKNLKLTHCSKGMKQKVGIIQVLINEKAEILFLDEPTRGLDPITTKELRDCLLERNRYGVTIVLNSHVLSEVEMICNKVAILDKGKVIIQDDLRNLLEHKEDVYLVEFQKTESIPDYVVIKEKTLDTIKGEVSLKHIKQFLFFIFENQIKLYQCELKRFSLEEKFYNIIKMENSHEKTNIG